MKLTALTYRATGGALATAGARQRSRQAPAQACLLGAALSMFTGLGLTSAPAQAITDRAYDIEVIVFRQLYEAGGDELWNPPVIAFDDTNTDLRAPAETMLESATEINPLLIPQILDLEQLQMIEVFESLKRSRNYRPILHEGWRMHLDNRADAAPRAITANDLPHRFSGEITVSAERKLHVDIDLQMSNGGQKYHLKEIRTLRRKDIHYFDHPMFGVIVRITRPALDDPTLQ